jgi:ribosomal protein L16 Arg81 hydroxylase
MAEQERHQLADDDQITTIGHQSAPLDQRIRPSASLSLVELRRALLGDASQEASWLSDEEITTVSSHSSTLTAAFGPPLWSWGEQGHRSRLSVREGTAAPLERCVGNPFLFTEEYWAQRPLYRRGGGGSSFDDLLNIQDVDYLIAESRIKYPDLTLVKDGEAIDPSGFTRDEASISGMALIDPNSVYEHFYAGATILLRGVHRSWPPLARFCQQIEHSLTIPTQANAYITPHRSRGLGTHYDSHDVVVLQATGSKRWAVYEPLVDSALETGVTAPSAPLRQPVIEAELKPGDCLYIPQGWPHAAYTTYNHSIHISIGLIACTWIDVFQEIIARTKDKASFRSSLPPRFASQANVLAPMVANRLRELAVWLENLDPLDVTDWISSKFWSSRLRTSPGQLGQLLDLSSLEDESLVRRRKDTVCQLGAEGRQLTLLLADRTLLVPSHLRPVVEQILRSETFQIRDLAAQLDKSSRLILVRRLVREGVLEKVQASSYE